MFRRISDKLQGLDVPTDPFRVKPATGWIEDLSAPDERVRSRAAAVLATMARQLSDGEVRSARVGLREASKARTGTNKRAIELLFEAVSTLNREQVWRTGPRAVRPDGLETLGDQDVAWDAIELLFETATIHEGRARFVETLGPANAGQRAVLAIWWTQSEVRNGGFEQFFANATAVVTPEALDGFRLVGAPEFADLLEEALALFPNSRPADDVSERRAQVDALGATSFRPISRRFYDRKAKRIEHLFACVARYVRSHPEEFFLPA